jgi:predicted Zn finger-like uncharacterized protein
MLITCTSCETSYQLTSASLGPAGRSVRCARCGHVWFAANTEALTAIADDHRAEMAAFATDVPAGEAPAAVAADPDAVPDGTESPPESGWTVPDEAPIDAVSQPEPEPEPEIAAEPAPDLITIEHAPALAPDDPSEPAAEAPPPPEDIETIAARRAKRAQKGNAWPTPGVGTAILALLALNTALLAWRADVVRLMPQTASLYAAIGLPVNLRGLSFRDLATTAEAQDGVQVLIVDGSIVNATPRVIEVPRMRFSLRNDKGQEVYTWTAQPPKQLLAPGETLPFRSRLASPPRDSHQVLVRFFNRRDLVAGVQ